LPKQILRTFVQSCKFIRATFKELVSDEFLVITMPFHNPFVEFAVEIARVQGQLTAR